MLCVFVFAAAALVYGLVAVIILPGCHQGASDQLRLLFMSAEAELCINEVPSSPQGNTINKDVKNLDIFQNKHEMSTVHPGILLLKV